VASSLEPQKKALAATSIQTRPAQSRATSRPGRADARAIGLRGIR
jgi:hypothetical protein